MAGILVDVEQINKQGRESAHTGSRQVLPGLGEESSAFQPPHNAPDKLFNTHSFIAIIFTSVREGSEIFFTSHKLHWNPLFGYVLATTTTQPFSVLTVRVFGFLKYARHIATLPSISCNPPSLEQEYRRQKIATQHAMPDK